MSIELSRRVGNLFGSMDSPPSVERRLEIARAVGQANRFADLPKSIQQYIKNEERQLTK